MKSKVLSSIEILYIHTYLFYLLLFVILFHVFTIIMDLTSVTVFAMNSELHSVKLLYSYKSRYLWLGQRELLNHMTEQT